MTRHRMSLDGSTVEGQSIFEVLKEAFRDVLRVHAVQRGHLPEAWVFGALCDELNARMLPYETKLQELRKTRELRSNVNRKRRRVIHQLKQLEQEVSSARADIEKLSGDLSVARQKFTILTNTLALAEECTQDPIIPSDPGHAEDCADVLADELDALVESENDSEYSSFNKRRRG